MNQDKVNQTARQLGVITSTWGHNLLKQSFHIQPREVSYERMKQVLSRFEKAVLLDSTYYLIPWSQWQEIIRVDWTDKVKYIPERRDCDNLAFIFCGRMSEIYGLQCGAMYGKILHKETGSLIAYHYWNIIIDSEEKIYFFEPQSDEFAEYKGGNVTMGSWVYVPIYPRVF